MKKLTKRDYKKITKFYKSKKHTRKNALKTISRKFCSCVEKVKTKKKGEAIGICTKSVINRKGFKRGKFSCKRKPSIQLYKGGKRRRKKKTRKKRGGSLICISKKNDDGTDMTYDNNGEPTIGLVLGEKYRFLSADTRRYNGTLMEIEDGGGREHKLRVQGIDGRKYRYGLEVMNSWLNPFFKGNREERLRKNRMIPCSEEDDHEWTGNIVRADGAGGGKRRRKKKTRKKKGGMTLEEIDNRINVLRKALTYWSTLSPNHPSTIDVRILTIFKIKSELEKLLLLKNEQYLIREMAAEEEGRDEPNLKKYGGRRTRKKRGSGGCASKPEPNDEDLKKTLDNIIKNWKEEEEKLQKIIKNSTCPNGAIDLQKMRENIEKYTTTGGGKRRKKKTRKKQRGGSPLPPVPYDDLKITVWNLVRNNGDMVYDMKNKKNDKVDKVRITKKFIETRPGDEHYGKKMIQFQRVYQVLDGSLGRWAVVSGRYEGYTPYADHTGPWTYITPYDDVVLTKHISTAKTAKLAAAIGLFGGHRKKKTRKRRRK